MAIAKPIRVLAILTMGLFVFLLYQIAQNPRVVKAPKGSEPITELIRDPNLDRMIFFSLLTIPL